jgi:hypothetical protein
MIANSFLNIMKIFLTAYLYFFLSIEKYHISTQGGYTYLVRVIFWLPNFFMYTCTYICISLWVSFTFSLMWKHVWGSGAVFSLAYSFADYTQQILGLVGEHKVLLFMYIATLGEHHSELTYVSRTQDWLKHVCTNSVTDYAQQKQTWVSWWTRVFK